MKKITLAPQLVFLAITILLGCGGSSSKKSSSSETQTEKEIQEKKESSSSVYGTYTLTDMITVKGVLEPTEQDLEYIKKSKERTLGGKTTLTIGEDGTFERIFPHPSGNGSTKIWNGEYEIMDNKLILNVDMNGKVHSLEFKILEQSSNNLSLVTDFGKLKMNYIYKK